MQDRNQGNNRPGQSGGQQGANPSPTPSGVPNEGRGTLAPGSGQGGREKQYDYKGGRQGQGGVPNPDDYDDDESAGSFRGTPGGEQGADQRRASPSDEAKE